MDGEFILIISLLMLAGTTTVALTATYLLGKSRRAQLPDRRVDAGLEQRIDRIERIAETMVVEVERIGDGQRFLMKVMADNQLVAPQRSPGRSITPH